MSLLSRIQMQHWLYTGFSCHFSMVTYNLEHYTYLIPLPMWQVQIVSCCNNVHVLDFWWIVHLSISFYALPAGVSVSPRMGGCPLSLMDLYQYFRNQTWFLEKGLTSHRPPTRILPVSCLQVGLWPGFWKSTVVWSEQGHPSFLLNSGEDECDSCWVWHFLWDLTLCQAGLCFREATCWVSAAPKVATGQWLLATKAGLCPGRRDCAQWKAPQGAPQGCTWASTGLHLPKMDKPLTHLSPFVFQEDGKCQGSQTLRHQPDAAVNAGTLRIILSLISVILYIDFIKSVITLLCSHKKQTIKKKKLQ